MEIKLKYGIDKLLFGMKQKDVEALYGAPNKKFVDDEDNVVFVYNDLKMKLTFYEEEDLKLGYINTSNENLKLFGTSIIGKPWKEVQDILVDKKITLFVNDSIEGTDNYFFESNWLYINVDYDKVYKIEMGAVFTANEDEFDWKF